MGNEEFFRKEMSEAYLVRLHDAGRYPYVSFYLRKPDTGIHRTLISFTREGIVLSGDLMLGQNASGGIVSNTGYGIEWFKGHLIPDYMASKFLRKVWVPEKAVGWVKYELEQDDEDLSEDRKKSLKEALLEEKWMDGIFGDAYRFGEWFSDVYDDSPESIGWDYDPNDLGWLVAVQERFSKLYEIFEFHETVQIDRLMEDEKNLLSKCTFTHTTPKDHMEPGYTIEQYIRGGVEGGILHIQRVMI